MGSFAVTKQRRKSSCRRTQLGRRRLTLEPLEGRQLLAVVSLNPVKDTTLFEDGTTGIVASGAGTSLSIGVDHYNNTIMRGLAAFDVANSIPAGSTINSVALSVWENYSYPRNRTPSIELHSVQQNWGEAGSAPDPTSWMPPYGPAQPGDATWNNTFYPSQSWTNPGGDFSSVVSGTLALGPANTGAFTWNSTPQMVADVQNWLDNPTSNFGWLLKQADETQLLSKMIDSRESANAAHRPTLTIDYTPPAAPTLAIAATDASKAEGNSGSTPFTFTVTRSGGVSGVSTVDYAVTGSGVNPANAADFAGGVLPSGSVTFNATETTKVVTINVSGDTAVEQDEAFSATLSSPVGGTISTAAASGGIINDDAAAPAPTLAIAATDASKAEGNSGSTPFTFTVTRSGDVSGVSTVNFAVTSSGVNPANAADFAGGVLPSGSVTFNATETTKVVTINVSGDTAVEQDEGFSVTLSNPVGGTISTAAASGGIINDDAAAPAPTLAIAATDASKAEGNSGSTALTFTVTRSGDVSGVSTVNFTVTGSGSSPANAVDFAGGVLPSGSVTFNATETTKVVTIDVNGDATVELDEGFTVTLSSPVGGTISTAAASGGIINDDSQASARFSISDVRRSEGNSGTTQFTFTVTLDAATAGPVSVDYATADGTASGERVGTSGEDDEDGEGGDESESGEDDAGQPSTSRGDYLAAAGTLNFAGTAGETQTITVLVRGDTDAEPDETFFVNLTNPLGGVIADGQGIGTILNDEQPGPGVALRDGVLEVRGTERADQVSVRPIARGEILVSASFLPESAVRRFKLTEVRQIDIRLYGGNDSAVIESRLAVPVVMDGGAGNDSLRGGRGQTILRGGDGQDQLVGGSGFTILVGDAGNDQLTAGSARSILIGGDGRDNLRGGDADDILVGGRTAYDNSDQALLAILAEWTSSQPRSTRVANLAAGVGAGGAYKLRDGETVFDDLARDVLAIRSGSDWFLVSPDDRINDRPVRNR